MKGRGQPPAVDDGDPRGLLETLRREQAPTPGRLGNTLRLLALVLATVTLGEVFRLPDLTVGACLALFVSGTEAGTAIMTSVLAGGALAIGTLATVAVFMVSLSEPALRLPLMAVLTFAAGFLMWASPLGPAFHLFGFRVVYTTTEGDDLLLPALQPAVITNTADPATSSSDFTPPSNSATGNLPDLVFFPPQEALLHGLLWLALVFIVALVLIALANWLTGRDPALILRAALADRLAAAAAFCEGAPGSRERLAGLAKEGVAKFTKMHEMGSKLHRHARGQEAGAQLIQEIARLVLALRAWARVAPDAPRDPLRGVAQACRAAEQVVRDGVALPNGTVPDGGRRDDARVPVAAAPLLLELDQAVQGFGPTPDLQEGRDRVLGILLGNIVVYLVFTTFWPVSVADKVRHGVADALERLADLLVLQRAEPARVFDPHDEKLRRRFGQAIAQAREVLVKNPYEPDRLRPDRGRSPINAAVVTQVQALIVPTSVILDHQPDPTHVDGLSEASRNATRAHNEATARWLRRWAAWVRTGEGAAELVAALPELPGLDAPAGTDAHRMNDSSARYLAAQAAWYGVLRQDIHASLGEIGPDAAPPVVRPQAAHAPA